MLASLLSAARTAGADTADALYAEGLAAGVSYRLGKLEEVERAETADLGLRVFVGKKIAFVSTTDFSSDAIKALPERAVAMARLAPEDAFAGLAPKERLAKTWPSLELEDAAEPSAETLTERAKAAESTALAVQGVTNSEGGNAGFSRSHMALATSEGFFGTYAGTHHSVSVSAIAGTGDGMQTDYDSASARIGEDLEAPEMVGARAGSRAVIRLNPRKVKSQSVPVVFAPRVSNGLLRHLTTAISGAAIARGVSFLKDCMGQEIFAPGIAVIDDPLRVRGLRSKPFDGEGVATRPMAVIENGVLKTWLLDCASARQLGLQTTGHAARGTSGPPSPAATNLYMQAGEIGPMDLIADIEQGFYVAELMGMGVNPVTGDYSRGASGFWIENGEIAYPVSEVTIAGNLRDMFRHLTAASDLNFRYGIDAPTCRIEGMTVAGE
jgi:PmbA protein